MKASEIKDATGTLAHGARRACNKGKSVIYLSANPVFNAILERSWKSLTAEGGISNEDMRRRLGLKRS